METLIKLLEFNFSDIDAAKLIIMSLLSFYIIVTAILSLIISLEQEKIYADYYFSSCYDILSHKRLWFSWNGCVVCCSAYYCTLF